MQKLKQDPVVETKAGKVRGFRLNTTYAFHGIHYAEADRFPDAAAGETVERNQKCAGVRLCMSAFKAG